MLYTDVKVNKQVQCVGKATVRTSEVCKLVNNVKRGGTKVVEFYFFIPNSFQDRIRIHLFNAYSIFVPTIVANLAVLIPKQVNEVRQCPLADH